MERKLPIWLSNEHRQSICLEIHKSCDVNGKPKYGLVKLLSTRYNVDKDTISRLWKMVYAGIVTTGTLNVCRLMAGRVGKKEKEFDVSKLLEIPFHERTTVRTTAYKLGVSKTRFHKIVKKGVIKRHSNAIKPHLTVENMRERVQFCLSKIESSSLSHEPKFIDFYDYVHVDEKWFYITKEAQSYYLLPEELEPTRTCKSKRFLMKVMFLAAVGRARIDESTGCMFDGKIGMWPFIFEEPAKRRSKNRAAGTLETKPLLSVTKEVYRSFLIDKLLPALVALWPDSRYGKVIYVQQDNARPHIDVNDVEFAEAGRKIGLNVQLECQPPNSPDMNVLDLGYFRSIESLQQKQPMTSINELIGAVEKSFVELPAKNLNYIFLTLQNCMIEVLKAKGTQKYRTPHMSKHMLERAGLLPTQIYVDLDLIEASKASLQE